VITRSWILVRCGDPDAIDSIAPDGIRKSWPLDLLVEEYQRAIGGF